jgi:hypothetical protein
MSKEIKEQIDKLNEEVEGMVSTGTFALNSRVAAIMCKINTLQQQCKHNFVNGVCEFRYMEEDS